MDRYGSNSSLIDTEEEVSILDDVQETDETASTAYAHAQAILDAYDSSQDELTNEENKQLPEAHLENLCVFQEYICLLENATLDEDKLDPETLYRLQNPLKGLVEISNPNDRLSLEISTATNSSQATYD
ncbi:hypothetical protein C0992_001991 [Termitomyces sp. T32_za158]|nr:hypothetical protein C0992_001991 [Termitomyces sp. T32_za158]